MEKQGFCFMENKSSISWKNKGFMSWKTRAQYNGKARALCHGKQELNIMEKLKHSKYFKSPLFLYNTYFFCLIQNKELLSTLLFNYHSQSLQYIWM